MSAPVSLQINLAPGDYPYARLILPHQLNCLSEQVNEIILTIDTKPSKGHFASRWYENKHRLYDFLCNEIQPRYPVKIIPVDYSYPIKSKIADFFFGTNDMPDKDYRGGPFYAYFFGLFTASNNLVFHLDSDMFLGGRSNTWINEAIEIITNDNQCLFVSPLPGPPHKDDILIGQSIKTKMAPHTYQINGMSSRIYFTDKSILEKHKITLKKPVIRNQVKSIIQGNPNADLPEVLFKDLMEKYAFKRIDFLGDGKGLWSLHPPYHNQLFSDNLETILANIEDNNLPASQYGFYDLVNEVCDWTDEEKNLKKNRWWKKLYAKPVK